MRLRIIFLLVSCLLFSSFLVSASSPGVCVTSEVTSINPSSVDTDEDFTVGLVIDNCGDKVPENISLEITRYSQDIIIKESLLTSIGKLGYANSQRFILYNMHTRADASPGEHVFETKLTYLDGGVKFEEYGSFSVIVKSEEPDLTISRIYATPEIIYSGDKVIMTIDFENAGEGKAKDVRVMIENFSLVGIKNKYLGSIDSGENIPARFVFDGNRGGIYDGNLTVTYKHGVINKELIFPFEVHISSKEFKMVHIFLIIIILALIGYFLLRKKVSPKK